MKLYVNTYGRALTTITTGKRNIVVDFTTGVREEFTERVSAKANESRIVKTFDVAELVTEEEKARMMIHAFLSDRDGNVISIKDHFFFWPNKLELPETEVKTTITYGDGEYRVTLSSDKPSSM